MPMQRRLWDAIWDGGSGQWLWLRHLDARKYHALRIDDLWDATGKETGSRYAGALLYVDLDDAPVDEAARCCGAALQPDGTVTSHDEVDKVPDAGIVEMCVSYGCGAPLANHEGRNRGTLERELKRESNALATDADAFELAMERPVNQIGSTAREYARGDFDSAMARGLAKGDANARLCVQMQRPIPQRPIPQGIACSVETAKVPSDDPLAYSMGFLAGFQGTKDDLYARSLGAEADLAAAYVTGRELGGRVRMGLEPAPE